MFEMLLAVASRMMLSIGNRRGWFDGSRAESSGCSAEPEGTTWVIVSSDTGAIVDLKWMRSRSVSSFKGRFWGSVAVLVIGEMCSR